MDKTQAEITSDLTRTVRNVRQRLDMLLSCYVQDPEQQEKVRKRVLAQMRRFYPVIDDMRASARAAIPAQDRELSYHELLALLSEATQK